MGKLRLAVLLMAAASGCAGLPPAPPELLQADEAARALPRPARNRVHVLFVHGYDPLDLAGMSDLRQHAVGLGYIKTYAGAPFQATELADAAQDAQSREPEARFVLVGHAGGCSCLAALGSRMQGQGLPVDAVLCLSPGSAAMPPAEQVVAIVRASDSAPAAHQTQVVEAGPLDLPTHPRTRATLSALLSSSAQRVSVREERRGSVFPLAARSTFEDLRGE